MLVLFRHLWLSAFLVGALAGRAGAAGAAARGGARAPVLPRTTPPIVYHINYSGDYFTKPDYINQFKAAPPDLLHVGKAVPISHHWGPTRLYQGENQYTGGPGHTLSWENIALLTPEALATRIETIRKTLRRCHAIGIREIAPYISYHTVAGDHEKRLGFWKFYDNWNAYATWAGPPPPRDPFDWLVVDIHGKFVGGSCGGYSPAYYAPLHRYRACINHPDWAEWHRRLVRMVAEVGYDGCFVDNAHPDACYCRYCKAGFRRFLNENRDLAWVRRLTEGLAPERLALDARDVPAELVRRWRLLRTRDHLGMLREVGRRVRPGFTIFPNSGRINECLQVGGKCDRLMFESTFSPGIQAADEPPETDAITITVSREPAEPKPITHRYERRNPDTFVEIEADLSLPATISVGKPARFDVKVASVGASLQDGDAAEDFHLLLVSGDAKRVRVDLEPPGAVGGSGSSRKPVRPPVTLKGAWTPREPGRYAVHFGFRYTDESHLDVANRRLHVAPLSRGRICRTHVAELLFSQHMPARSIYLGYDARRNDNVQQLALAEMAAFSGGGGFSARGTPQATYRAFFKKHGDLFDGWQPTATAAVLYASWGRNPLNTQHPLPEPTIHEYLAATHRLTVALIDAALPERAGDLGRFRVLYLPSPAYEMDDTRVAALRGYLKTGGRIALGDEEVTINGMVASGVLGADGVHVWDWSKMQRGGPLDSKRSTLPQRCLAPTPPVARADGRAGNLRFALYRKDERLALHVVNYNVCLLDKAKKVLEVEPTPVRVPLPDGWAAAKATCFDPDAAPATVPCAVAAGAAGLTLPTIRIYKIVLIEKI